MFHVSYLDASAAVRLVLDEPGFENLRNYLHLRNRRMTTLCFAEALGVLKRKWQRRELSDKQYLGCCYLLVHGCRITLEDTGLEDRQTFMKAIRIAQKYKLDLSDAVQLLTVKYGKFSPLVEESKSLLITADGDLASAARAEGLRVWNCRTDPAPTPQ